MHFFKANGFLLFFLIFWCSFVCASSLFFFFSCIEDERYMKCEREEARRARIQTKEKVKKKKWIFDEEKIWKKQGKGK